MSGMITTDGLARLINYRLMLEEGDAHDSLLTLAHDIAAIMEPRNANDFLVRTGAVPFTPADSLHYRVMLDEASTDRVLAMYAYERDKGFHGYADLARRELAGRGFKGELQ